MLYPATELSQTERLVGTGKGVYVYDDRGSRYLEGMAGLWYATLGYGTESY